jgi:hypothetical protein
MSLVYEWNDLKAYLLHSLHGLGVLLHPKQNMALPEIAFHCTAQLYPIVPTQQTRLTELGIDLDGLLCILQCLRECNKLCVRVSAVVVPARIRRIALD